MPCAIIAEPGADADCASRSQSPLRKKPVSGRLPSTVIVEGTAVNQVGGSTIAVSVERYEPVIGLVPLPELFQLTIPLRPFPERLAAVRPVTWPPAVRKLAPFVMAPR